MIKHLLYSYSPHLKLILILVFCMRYFIIFIMTLWFIGICFKSIHLLSTHGSFLDLLSTHLTFAKGWKRIRYHSKEKDNRSSQEL